MEDSQARVGERVRLRDEIPEDVLEYLKAKGIERDIAYQISRARTHKYPTHGDPDCTLADPPKYRCGNLFCGRIVTKQILQLQGIDGSVSADWFVEAS